MKTQPFKFGLVMPWGKVSSRDRGLPRLSEILSKGG